MKKRNLEEHMLSSLPTTISDLSGGTRYLSAEGVDANAGRRNEQGDKTAGKRCVEVAHVQKPGNRLCSGAGDTTLTRPLRVVNSHAGLDSGS